jgi:DNA-binding protein
MYCKANEVYALTKKEGKPKNDKTAADNIVFIGRKPIMSYVTACITFFNRGEKQVVIKARGRAISRAVDTVELLRRAFIKDLKIESISINTEEFVGAESQKSNVSIIEIVITKFKQPQEN